MSPGFPSNGIIFSTKLVVKLLTGIRHATVSDAITAAAAFTN